MDEAVKSLKQFAYALLAILTVCAIGIFFNASKKSK